MAHGLSVALVSHDLQTPDFGVDLYVVQWRCIYLFFGIDSVVCKLT